MAPRGAVVRCQSEGGLSPGHRVTSATQQGPRSRWSARLGMVGPSGGRKGTTEFWVLFSLLFLEELMLKIIVQMEVI